MAICTFVLAFYSSRPAALSEGCETKNTASRGEVEEGDRRDARSRTGSSGRDWQLAFEFQMSHKVAGVARGTKVAVKAPGRRVEGRTGRRAWLSEGDICCCI